MPELYIVGHMALGTWHINKKRGTTFLSVAPLCFGKGYLHVANIPIFPVYFNNLSYFNYFFLPAAFASAAAAERNARGISTNATGTLGAIVISMPS